MKFSVLVSIYAKEKPEYFDLAFSSIWDHQTLKPNQIVLVKDGPLPPDLDNKIMEWKKNLGDVLNLVELHDNLGLGAALNEGLKFCKYELVARMDTDDISLPERFESQVGFMKKNYDIAVSSSWLEEFDESLKQPLSIRKVPASHDEIISFGKRRNPLNHPVVMFRKSTVLQVGGYPPFKKSQDYALWALMISRGYRMANIPEVLLNMRTGEGLMARRGLSYLIHEYKILHYQKQIGFIGWKDFLVSLAIRSAVRLPPAPIRNMLYKLAR